MTFTTTYFKLPEDRHFEREADLFPMDYECYCAAAAAFYYQAMSDPLGRAYKDDLLYTMWVSLFEAYAPWTKVSP